MRIEVLCTGDELLTGLTTDTNSPYFMGRLFELGEKVVRAQTVGDVREDITGALRAVSERADAVLVSGGLGPTADDLTAECAAATAGVPLVEDAPTLERIRARFARLGVTFTPNNARQAMVPRGAEVVPNAAGTAPMFILRIGGCTLFFVPGVPREYRHLVDHEVLPRLKAMIEAQPARIFRAARLLKTVGMPESHLDAAVAPLAPLHPQVVFGFRTHASSENHLKLTAEGKSQEEADRALAAAEEDCRRVLALHVFGAGQDEFPAAVGALLERRGETVVLAEGCTGGLAGQLLSAAPGASRYFLGSAVAYQDGLKRRWAGVEGASLDRWSAVSREVALEMAKGVRAQAGATYGLSIVGFAGPGGGTPEEPVGTIYCALVGPDEAECERHHLTGGRERIRGFATYRALELLRRRLLRAREV